MIGESDAIFFLLKASLYSFVFVLGVFGNMLVIVATVKFRTLHKPINVLVCNLCLVDVLTMVVGIALFVLGDITPIKTDLAPLTCRVFKPILAVLVTANVLTLVSIAIERYTVVLHASKSYFTLTLKTSFMTVTFLNVLSILLGIPTLLSKRYSHICVCNWSKTATLGYQVVLFVLQYLAPLIGMALLYLLIWYKIRSKNKQSIKIFNTNRSPKISEPLSVSQPNIRRSFSDEETTFKSGSRNHLSGLGRRRCSSSLENLKKFSSQFNISDKRLRSGSDCHLEKCSLKRSNSSIASFNSSLRRNSTINRSSSFRRNSVNRRSLRGSVRRLHRSVTSVIVGTDLEQATAEFTALRYKQTMKTLKVFVCLLFVFCFCMLPHQVTALLDVLAIHTNIHHYLDALVYVNVAINPWLYGGMNSQFQNAFRKMFYQKRVGLTDMLRHGMFVAPRVHMTPIIATATERTKWPPRKLSQLKKSPSIQQTVIPTNTPLIIITCYDDDLNCPFL